VSGAAGRVVVRRRLVRGAEVRLFAAARAHAARIARGAKPAAVEPELPSYVQTLAELEAAAKHYTRVAPAPARRRRRS